MSTQDMRETGSFQNERYGGPGGMPGGEGERGMFRGEQPDGRVERLANALGWASIGLGLAGLVAPHQVARLIGVPDDRNTRDVLRVVGVREIAQGIGILMEPRPTGWVWSRVAGDVMDLSLLGAALAAPNTQKDRVATATAAVAGITALDLYCSQELSRGEAGAFRPPQMAGIVEEPAVHRGVPRAKAITVRRPQEEVYRCWRDFRNLARFMRNVESVEEREPGRTHWRALGPAGIRVEWDAEIVEDRPNELIAWRSLPGSQVHHCGRVEFRPAPGGRGTEIHVLMEFAPPGGKIGEIAARLFGKDPQQQLGEDLRRFKQVLETGEVVLSEGSLGGLQFPQHPAQPPRPEELARLGIAKQGPSLAGARAEMARAA